MALVPLAADGRLLTADEIGSLPNAPSQGDFRQQVANLTDLCRQMFGDAVARPGSGGPADPLNAAFELYVDPVRGVDTFAHGDYNSYDPAGVPIEEQVKNKLKRISKQRMVCGYTKARPFRTINRAAIEAAIITSRSWFINDPLTFVDCIVVYLSAGVHVVLNDPGTGAVAAWPDGHIPTDAELIAFNPAEGGVILPRYASVQGADLRKTTLRPNYVPPSVDEAADYSNRTCFLRTTPGSLFFGMSFFDGWGITRSHHLLDCFQFSSATQLNDFYAKVATACAAGADLDPARLVARPSETNVVGPFVGYPTTPNPTWDVTTSASSYVYNCSIRSDYGIGGIFADGSKVGGLKSFVTAQFTGSLQKDLSSWEVFKGGAWVQPADYAEYIAADPDNVRMNPKRVSRHISAINNAFIQEVSVFAIGQGIHHYTDLGGEITITNSNSSFGGCAAISKGYKAAAFPIDTGWQISKVKVPTDLSDKTSNVRKIRLGRIATGTADDATTLTLTADLAISPDDPNNPLILTKDGYTLKPGSYLWIENPTGLDFRAPLAATPWTNANPNQIRITAALENEKGEIPGAEKSAGAVTVVTPPLAGMVCYVRRLIDVRTPDERRYSIQLTNTGNTRTPVRDFILQTDDSSLSINRALRGDEALLVSEAIRLSDTTTGSNFDAEVTIRRANANSSWTAGKFYRAGTTVRQGAKHWTSRVNHLAGSAFDPDLWTESFVHMPTDYNPEDFRKTSGPIIVFDDDGDPLDASTDLGYDLTTVWQSDVRVKEQVASASDYQGLRAFLESLGCQAGDIDTLMAPRPADDRAWNPSAGVAGVTPPADAAAGWNNWPVKFHRPSVLRLYSHAWEWAGFLNYTKSLPPVQAEMSPQNKFTYYFTNQDGGRVYGTGNNEDGFAITPAGLTNISTGETEAVEDVGTSESSFDAKLGDSFDKITVNELTVNNTIDAAKYLNLPEADTNELGIVRLATEDAVRDVFQDGLGTYEATDVVPLGGMSSLKDGILREIRILEKRYSIAYIDFNANRQKDPDDGIMRAQNVSAEVWTDIKANRGLHELSSWTGPVPPTSSAANKTGREFVFSSVDEFFEFVDDREPLGKVPLVVLFYGTTTMGSKKGNYAGASDVVLQAGPSAARDAKNRSPVQFLGNRVLTFNNALRVQVSNLHLHSGTSVGAPTAAERSSRAGRPLLDVGGPDRIDNCEIYLWNVGLTNYNRGNSVCSCITGNWLRIGKRFRSYGPGGNRHTVDVLHDILSTGEIVNFNSFFWGQKVDIWTRHSDNGERYAFNLTVKDIYTNTTNGNKATRKSYVVFRPDQELIYNASSYQATTSTNFGMDWNFTLNDYYGAGLVFSSPHFPRVATTYYTAEYLPSNATNLGDWDKKKTTVTITPTGGTRDRRGTLDLAVNPAPINIVPDFSGFTGQVVKLEEGASLVGPEMAETTGYDGPRQVTNGWNYSLLNQFAAAVRRFANQIAGVTADQKPAGTFRVVAYNAGSTWGSRSIRQTQEYVPIFNTDDAVNDPVTPHPNDPPGTPITDIPAYKLEQTAVKGWTLRYGPDPLLAANPFPTPLLATTTTNAAAENPLDHQDVIGYQIDGESEPRDFPGSGLA